MDTVLTFVVYCAIFGISKAPECIELKEGSGVSFIDLWEQVGTTIDDKDKGIYRNTLLDRNFSQGCPLKISFKFVSSDKTTLVLRYNEPFVNNTFAGVLASEVNNINYEGDSVEETVVIQARPEEDVIFKGFAENDQDDLYFAVYFLKNMTGYPKYYVKPYHQKNVSIGTFPDFEHLYDMYETLRIFAKFNTDCFVETTTVQKTTDIATEAFQVTTSSLNTADHACYIYYYTSVHNQPNVTTSQPAWTIGAGTSTECCLRCSQDYNICKSVFFIQSTNTCIGLSHAENAIDRPNNAVHLVPYNCVKN